MSYTALVTGGVVKTASKEAILKAKEILASIGIDTDEAEDTETGYTCSIYPSDWVRYSEEDYEPLSEHTASGTYIRFFGEDKENVWTLYPAEGKVIDQPGEIMWAAQEPSDDNLRLLCKADDLDDPDYKSLFEVLELDRRSLKSLEDLKMATLMLMKFKRRGTRLLILDCIDTARAEKLKREGVEEEISEKDL